MRYGLFFVLVFCVLAAPASAQVMQPGVRSITVSGESHEEIAPDQAILSMSLTSRNSDLMAAKRQNDEMVEKLVKITAQFNIPREKVATSNVYISPEYSYDQKNGTQQLTGYQVNRSIRVTMDRLDIHERVLSAVVAAKIDQVNGVEFTLAEPEEHAAALRVKAFENARAKAEALAKAAGTKLGRALTISTEGAPSPVMPPMPMMMKAERMGMADSMSVAPSLPGLIRLQESVHVVFELQ